MLRVPEITGYQKYISESKEVGIATQRDRHDIKESDEIPGRTESGETDERSKVEEDGNGLKWEWKH